jgi:hypothetical protein
MPHRLCGRPPKGLFVISPFILLQTQIFRMVDLGYISRNGDLLSLTVLRVLGFALISLSTRSLRPSDYSSPNVLRLTYLQGLSLSIAQTFAMQTEVNRQWENLFAQNLRLKEELGRFTGQDSLVQVLEAENSRLKNELAQSTEKLAESEANHHRSHEEWKASCAKMNEELRSRVEAYRRHQSEAAEYSRQLLGTRNEIKALKKTASAAEGDRIRLAAALKRREEEVFWFLDQGVAGAVQSFRTSPDYVEALAEFNVVAEFVGRVEGFEDGFRYASEGKPKADCPYLDPQAESKRFLAQTAFENIQVPLLRAIADCAPDLNVNRVKKNSSFRSFLRRVKIQTRARTMPNKAKVLKIMNDVVS